MSPGNRKLVVLGVPWDVDTEGLKQYMCQFGELDDVIVMKDRVSRRSRGFGYVTFSSSEDAEKAMAAQHLLHGRALEVKVATPKEESGKFGERAFPGAYGAIDNYVSAPRFGAFGMSPFGGCDFAGSDPGVTGAGNNYGSNYGASNMWPAGPPPPQAGHVEGPLFGMEGIDPSVNKYGSAAPLAALPRMGKKIFVGRVPVEATTEDLRLYFSQFGKIVDVYLPKDAKKISHRGFGFVTFAEESSTERVALKRHEILGHQIAVDRAAPLDEPPSKVDPSNSLFGGAGGPLRASSSTIPGSSYGNVPGDHDYNSGWAPYGILGPMASADGGTSGHRVSRMEPRYRPY